MFLLPALGGMSGLGMLSTAVSVIGTLADAKATADAAEYNATVARQQADNASAVAGQKEEAQRRAARIFQGQQRAAIAESGAGLGGSNADIERQSEIFQELDALNIRYEGTLQRKGLLDQASLYDIQAENAMTAGYIGAAGKLFGGLSSSYAPSSAYTAPMMTIGGG